MKPTLRQLQYLVAIADEGSFSRAADAAGVSQPSLSTQVRDMEEVLGATLVERGRGGAPLTPIGEELVGRARLVLRDMEALKVAARDSGQTLAGRIRLGTLPTVGPYLLPLAVRRLHALYPSLRIEVGEENTRDLDTHLRDGRLDVIISTPEAHPGMRCADLFEERLHIAVAPDDPLAGKEPGKEEGEGSVKVSDLAGRRLLTLGTGHKLASLVERIADEAGAALSTGYRGTSLDALRQMAAMGGDVAVMPSLYTYSEAREDPGVVVRRIDHGDARRTIALVWRPTSPLSAKFEALAEVMREAARELLGVPGS